MNVIKFVTSAPFNMAINNIFWAGCVIGRYDLLWLVAPAILCYVALLVYARVIQPSQLIAPVGLGILIDSIYTALGIFQFEHHSLLLPLWMCTLWIAFATTLPLSLRLFGKNPLFAAVTGAVGFSFSYYVGYKLGAITFGLALPWVFALVSTTWAIALPLMFKWTHTQQVMLNEVIEEAI
ncbi:MAG: DUF2878 domain-containing protein [Gammaproteobacteria bacterium]|nr:DUF2878 domain-containing protein [Gammaproteobacteria bacterium]